MVRAGTRHRSECPASRFCNTSGIVNINMAQERTDIRYLNWRWSLLIVACFFAAASHRDSIGTTNPTDTADASVPSNDPVLDQYSAGPDWVGFGGSAGEQRYSALDQVGTENITQLTLAWYYDLPTENSVSSPIAADGRLFTATGHSTVRAFDGATGQLLWEFDSHARERSGFKLRQGYGSKGLAYEDGRLFVPTHDGRLIALSAVDGSVLWEAVSTEPGDLRFIDGPPRAMNGKVIIGHGGADGSGARGYVDCFDSETGKRLWRFYTVPGDPADGFENPAMEMAAKTWSGEWWRYGGGGTVWNAMTYDPELDRIYIGTGNGFPFNQEFRSEGKGDNLFLSSIVALDASTGEYVWHYQTNPGEQWDYNASMDMTLATLEINGHPRKVLMQAPKNGFFYVLDREDGSLISAEPIAKVTWAERIDLQTARPVENPGARYHGKPEFELWPSISGAHSWLPQSFNPVTGLVYIPVIERGSIIGDEGVTAENYRGPTNMLGGAGITGDIAATLPGGQRSFLKAWNPVTQSAGWSVELPGDWPGGTMTTAGNLVFQGRIDGLFVAYSADTGKALWTYNAQSPIVAPPITYEKDGQQYITVITGSGGSGGGLFASGISGFDVDYRSTDRRVLTFSLGGNAVLPEPAPAEKYLPDDPDYRRNEALESAGYGNFHLACAGCHGKNALPGGAAPDLRKSTIVLDKGAFLSVVQKGALVPRGMPQFDDLDEEQLESIRQYLRSESDNLRKSSLP